MRFRSGSVGFLISSIPITPASVGVGQAAFYYVTNVLLTQQSNFGPAVITIYQGTSLAWGLVGGIIYLQLRSGAFVNSAIVAAQKPETASKLSTQD